MYLLPFIEILSHRAWGLLKELEKPELKELGKRYLDTMLYTRADSIVRKYLGFPEGGG